MKSADSVSSEEGRALPCLKGGGAAQARWGWSWESGGRREHPAESPPGPGLGQRHQHAALVSGLTWHPPIVLCVNQVKFLIVVRYTQPETFHPDHVCVCTPVALSTFTVLCKQPAGSLRPAELKLCPVEQPPSSRPQLSAFWLCESDCSRRLTVHPCGSIVQNFLPLQG